MSIRTLSVHRAFVVAGGVVQPMVGVVDVSPYVKSKSSVIHKSSAAHCLSIIHRDLGPDGFELEAHQHLALHAPQHQQLPLSF